jgi:hypothetical protein
MGLPRAPCLHYFFPALGTNPSSTPFMAIAGRCTASSRHRVCVPLDPCGPSCVQAPVRPLTSRGPPRWLRPLLSVGIADRGNMPVEDSARGTDELPMMDGWQPHCTSARSGAPGRQGSRAAPRRMATTQSGLPRRAASCMSYDAVRPPLRPSV